LSRALILILIAAVTLANNRCDQGSAPDYNWHPQLYATDSETESIIRGDEIISCSQTEFNTMICMPVNDIAMAKRAYFEAVNQCKTWKSKAARIKVYQLGHQIDVELQ